METNIDNLIKKDFEDFKELFFEKLQSITENSIIIETLNKIKNNNNNNKEKNFNTSKYIETQLYNIGGKEYMIDTKNGIVFSGKRADIIEILSHDELEKLQQY
jgi:uncharacterized protein YdaT